MHDFTAAMVSIRCRWGDLAGNLRHTVAAVERAGRDGARLLLLPECSLTGADWPTGETSPARSKVAITLDHPCLDELRRAAARTGVVIATGFYERLRSSLRITQALVGPGGLLGVYRKVHEPGLSSTDADLFPVFTLPFARLGINICYDNMFPECARILALKGAEILLSPFTSLPLSRREWRLERLVALRSRAQDNRLFVLSASHAHPRVPGRPREWGYSGICCAINPLGKILAESTGRTGRPQYLCVRLSEQDQRTYFLADVPAIRSRRAPDYRALSDRRLQHHYEQHAAPFVYDERRSLNIVCR